ncbi:zinc-ribbon domain containing protein [Luteolibacter pohnpeiensis]|uniref:Zinc-ribbon domain containing protein n=1 Tax=Luteolibacter pohnpeiensis TaxID=454153 RepID=A0A934SCB8_9BACT|nr:zinc-ribbon domain containing protein [Luteolibacter pohnpeiensis]MBK1882663.1 zinc-ribbon domain containing protein [Luteolibacter pohnpeiensis]
MPDNLVDHPRYGRRPRITGCDLRGDNLGLDPSWKYTIDDVTIIPDTGIRADVSKQHGSAIPIYVYYDVLKTCVDCRRPFIFFAEEQRYWFETLGFANDANCIRCVECRKKQQTDDRVNSEYQQLLKKEEKSWEDFHDLANAALDLHVLGRFKRMDRIRHYFNQIPDSEHHRLRIKQLKERIKKVEQVIAPQPAARFESDSEDGGKPQPESKTGSL